jgi:hypothetical protein
VPQEEEEEEEEEEDEDQEEQEEYIPSATRICGYGLKTRLRFLRSW